MEPIKFDTQSEATLLLFECLFFNKPSQGPVHTRQVLD